MICVIALIFTCETERDVFISGFQNTIPKLIHQHLGQFQDAEPDSYRPVEYHLALFQLHTDKVRVKDLEPYIVWFGNLEAC